MDKNNWMVEYKENFITKFKNFFKKLFWKKEKQNNVVNEEHINEIKEENVKKQNDFNNDIKLDPKLINQASEKEKFLEEIEGNEEALYMLSVERLQKLEKYYENIIEQNNETIRKLKTTA